MFSIRRNPYGALAVLSFAGITGTSYMYYAYREHRKTFQIPVVERDGKGGRVKRIVTLPLLVPDTIESRFQKHGTRGHFLKDGVKWNWNTAQLASNNPIEDAFANNVVERDPAKKDGGTEVQTSRGSLLFFTVFDGHGGSGTSRLLSQTLIPTVGLELLSLINGSTAQFEATSPQSIPDYLRSWLSLKSQSPPSPRFLDQDPNFVSLAIQTAFTKLDSHIINAPLRIMEEYLARPDKDSAMKELREDPLAKSAAETALSGSCALLALLDTASRSVYVACTGDSRAVAGYFDDQTGSWNVDVLTEDQTGRNPNELKRMQEEHPEEKETVIRRGRVLGGLEPTRAFGDARYKWSRDLQEKISRLFFSEFGTLPRPPPINLSTPPYVTSRPEVTCKTEALPSSDVELPNSKMRFLVLATDGLWDELSSQEACALVAGHLAGLKGTILKKNLVEQVKLSTVSDGIDGKKKEKKEDLAGSWVFKDDNIATHLIRNALGGGNPAKLQQLVSIPAPFSRNFRDDITVTVVWWEEGKEAEEQQVKAKL